MKRIPMKYYEEYRPYVVALNERTYDLFVDLYENGPLNANSIRCQQTLAILVNAKLVWQIGDSKGVMVGVSRLGQELFERIMDVIEVYN